MDAKLVGIRRTQKFDHALDGLLEQRFAGLVAQAQGRCEIYGEVNSYLRYETAWLQKRFSPTILRIYRDGRDFVRSSYTRTVYTAKEGELPVLPMDDDPYADQWASMTRFEKLCWYWNDTNRYLIENVADGGKMEQMLSDYDYFKERIVEPLGLVVSREDWSGLVSRPRNTSTKYNREVFLKRLLLGTRREAPPAPIPHWSKWDAEMTRQFWSICGDTMSALGYA